MWVERQSPVNLVSLDFSGAKAPLGLVRKRKKFENSNDCIDLLNPAEIDQL